MLLLRKLMKFIISVFLFFFVALNCVMGHTCTKANQSAQAKTSHSSSLVTFQISLRILSPCDSFTDKNDFLSFENDDDDLIISRKYVLLSQGFFFVTFFPKFFDVHNSINSEVIPTVNSTILSSAKYIFIRTLRI